MRISIQQDFTLGGIVQFFDPLKKGCVTVSDLRRADTTQSLERVGDDDLKFAFGSATEL